MSLACAPAARVVASSHRRAQRVQRAQNARALLRQPRRAVGGVRRGLVTKAQGNEVQVEEVVEELQAQETVPDNLKNIQAEIERLQQENAALQEKLVAAKASAVAVAQEVVVEEPQPEMKEEPVVEEPVIEEPVAETPPPAVAEVEEPPLVEPVVENVVVEEPIVEELAEEPVVEAPPASQEEEFASVVASANVALLEEELLDTNDSGMDAPKIPLQSLALLINSNGDATEKVDQAETLRKIVFVTSEVAPWSKTGGLGDVCGALPIALAERGHRVMVVSPRYMNKKTASRYENAVDLDIRSSIWCFGGDQEVAFFHEYKDGVDWVFIDHPSFHREGNPYGDENGAFGDNQFRYTLMSLAACEAPLVLPLGGYNYGDDCIFVANDWHAGLVPVYIASRYRPHGVFTDARTVFAIHNMSHQGVEPASCFDSIGVPGEWYGALEWVFPEWARAHELDTGEAVNYLKGAIVCADRVVTVSEGYAWEITTVEGGWGLDALLRSRQFKMNGIVNGINLDQWNPETDPAIEANYTVDDMSGKAKCKEALQRELGLPVRDDVPLVGFIGRLDWQKGPDLIFDSADRMLRHNDIQLVMLGSGTEEYETKMRFFENEFGERFRGWVGFSVETSHKITAGCDILLMPSRFEPCGLNQLYAMHYGTIPVVHATGGLRDTVQQYNKYGNSGEGEGYGWQFSPPTEDAMLDSLFQAVDTYKHDKEAWEKLMIRGMERDLSWRKSALQYEQVFEWAAIDPPYC